MIPSAEAWQTALELRHGKTLHQRFSAATIAICGLGGLGSHLAIALARAGIGHLILIDFDRVDLTNLHRQHYKVDQIGTFKATALAANLREIAPYLSVTSYIEKVTPENLVRLLQPADIVCEAFDVAEEKAMITDGVLSQLPHSKLIASSGMAGMGSPNAIRTRQITNRFFICGDGESDVHTCGCFMISRVMLCAAHQAHTALRLLAGEETL